MNVKIVFNGHEYSNVEAMPPDVRQEYEVTLDLLSKTSDRGMISKLLDAVGVRVQATIRRRIVVNGKEYASADELPPELRQRFEQAVAAHASHRAGPRASRTVPSPPPAVVPDDQARRSPLVRIAWWVALGVVLALWLLGRR
jgi:hypothetical protein